MNLGACADVKLALLLRYSKVKDEPNSFLKTIIGKKDNVIIYFQVNIFT